MLLTARAICARIKLSKVFNSFSRTSYSFINRSISYDTFRSRRNHAIDLPIGGNGTIKLDISYPENSSTTSGPIIIYLPNPPELQSLFSRSTTTTTKTTSLNNKILSKISSNTTLITINYRLSSEKFKYPTPIHDVSIGFSHILSKLLLKEKIEKEKQKISLLGETFGGSLAIMIGLTIPKYIHSIGIIEPLIDWVSLDELIDSGMDGKQKTKDQDHMKMSTKKKVDAAKGLINLRSKLFTTPSTYFDPFSSPILFLRAPGRDTPLFSRISSSSSSMDKTDTESYGPYDDDWKPHHHRNTRDESQVLEETPIKRRKVLRRWFPLEDGLSLPNTKIFIHDNNDNGDDDLLNGYKEILKGQGIELSDLLRRVCFDDDKNLAKEKVQLGKLLDKDDDGIEKCIDYIYDVSK